MRTLGEMIGTETIKLAEPKVEVKLPQGNSFGIKTTPKNERVSLAELEQHYRIDPVIFNMVNRVTQVIMSGGYKIVGSPKSVAYIEEFLENVGKRGGNTEWDTLLEMIFKYQVIYGRTFTEIIYNVEGTQIMDLDFIDPKKMDYAKDSNGKIVLDINYNPVGYVETIPVEDVEGTYKSDPFPKTVSLDSNQIFLNSDRVTHYKLYTYGDAFYGLGLIEPIYVTSVRKLELEKALANIYLRTAFPTKYATVGNQFHEATDEMLTRIQEELEDVGYDSVMSIPDYVKLDMLEPSHSEKMQFNLKYFIDEEVTGAGIPKAFALGSGEETNRATLGRQEYLFKLGLYDIVERTTKTIEKEIFEKIADLNNLPDVPKIEWGEFVLEELDAKAKRLVQYVQAGLLIPDDEIEALIRKREGLPETEVSVSSDDRRRVSVQDNKPGEDEDEKDDGSKGDKEPEDGQK